MRCFITRLIKRRYGSRLAPCLRDSIQCAASSSDKDDTITTPCAAARGNNIAQCLYWAARCFDFSQLTAAEETYESTVRRPKRRGRRSANLRTRKWSRRE